MKKGFTLVELLAVVIIMGIIFGVVTVNILGVINKTSDKEYQAIAKIFEKATELYVDTVQPPELDSVNGSLCVTLQNLADEGLITLPMVDPRSDSNFEPSTCIFVQKSQDGKLYFEFDATEPTLNITLNGPTTVSVACSATGNYNDPGAKVVDRDKPVTNVYAPSLSLRNWGTHTLNYKYTNSGGIEVKAKRTVKIGKGTPVITVSTSQTTINHPIGGTYVAPTATAEDPCEGTVAVTTVSNVVPGAIGTYSITFTATNSVGNTATKVIPVNVYALPAACFTFSAGTITNYDTGNPLCKSGVIIPPQIGGVNVTKIGAHAFYGKGITSVILPTTLQTIDQFAFSGNMLETLIIPNNVTSIINQPFSNNRLKTLVIGTGVKTIPLAAFYNNQLTSLTLPNTLTTIGALAFSDNLLPSVSIPASVTSIESSAFKSNRLTSITFGNQNTNIAGAAFNDNLMPDATAFIHSTPANTTVINSYAGAKRTGIVIPSSNTAIGTGAFSDINLQNDGLTIPTSVTSIGDWAFQNNCFTSITIPNSIVTIGDSAFSGSCLTAIAIPNSVKTIKDGAFSNSVDLKTINLPNALTTLGWGAFDECDISGPLTIPSTLTTIGEYAFRDNKISSVVLPNGMTSLKDGVFQSNLITSINIPSTITTIGYSALESNLLTSITLPNTVTTIGSDAFSNNRLTSFTVPTGVTKLPSNMLENNLLTSFVMPNTVTEVGAWFLQNNRLTSLTLSNNIMYLSNDTFKNNQLTTVTIPNKLAHLFSGVFANNPMTLAKIDRASGTMSTLDPTAFPPGTVIQYLR